ncbi:hypothetical protein Pth03_30040 [Planotetraspora thailandica]|uniref:Uncharacterized protein n=1 Tax=Planotetraspora thailandica TaxID=487172 RepID=A0A8J3VC96_9ACTN|nr:hypothetical protein Pth03_30040 [Planotetraspora thailandica]
MHDDMNHAKVVRPGVIRDPDGDLRDRFFRHVRRLVAPTLVSVLVDVAMIASEIASTGHLEHELAKGHDGCTHVAAVVLLNGRIEGEPRFGGGFFCVVEFGKRDVAQVLDERGQQVDGHG